MKHRIKSAFSGLLALFVASAAFAQQFPTVPSQSVIGRLGTPGTTGPSQAIPFKTLQSQLLPTASAANLGVKQDGITVTGSISITSGGSSLAASSAAFTSIDVGKYILVPGAGTAGGYLVTTIASFTDATHIGLAANASTSVSASKTITYCSDDQTTITSAVSTVLSQNKTLLFGDGIVCHSGTLNWAYNNLHVQFQSDNTTFIHTGTGIAHSFNGIANYPATQGAAGGVFGGPGRPMLRGNPNGNTTSGVRVDNWHFGYMKVAIRDATTGLLGTDSGIVGSSAVETHFDIRITNNADGAFIIQPNSGIDFTAPVASVFERIIVEGTGANSKAQVYLTGAINNIFSAGTVESGSAGGIVEDSTSAGNTFINLGIETNGTAEDIKLAGTSDVLINVRAAGTTAGQKFNGVSTKVIGGIFQSAIINDNTFHADNAGFTVACTNNGTNTTVINQPATVSGVASNLCTAVEQATSILGNKTINTANATTIKINGNTLAASAGTATITLPNVAATLLYSGGPLGTPSSGVATNLTGLPISTGLTGAGTGVLTALGVNVGTAGAFVVNGGALGTPSSGTVTNLTGTASININGTVGATTPAAGTFTTLTAGGSGETTLIGPGGTGAASAFLKLFGANASAQGAKIKFSKNDAGTTDWFLGHVSVVEATGTSSDLEYFNVSTSVRTMRLSIADDSVAFAAAVASTSPSTGTIKVTGGAGIGGALYVGAEMVSGAVAVGSLPTCNAAHKAARHFVTDANATFTAGIGAVVAAGGANNVPVTCDGTSWRIGTNDNIQARLIRKYA